jgi:N-acetylneuraminate synthase
MLTENSAHTYIIAEAGVNHNGDEALARRLIDIAADAKADAVKFQLFSPDALVTHTAPTAQYQATNLHDPAISQRDMLASLALAPEAFVRLEAHAQARGIDFLCTPFDLGSLDFLVKNTHMGALKLGSGELTNGPFLLEAARSGLPILLSTGMGNLAEIAEALHVLYAGVRGETHVAVPVSGATPEMCVILQSRVTLLHCVSMYPAAPASIHLRAMDTLHEHFGLPIGYSDHTLGLAVAIAAVARGARVIEKHFTFDKAAKGPDHAASLTPEELRDLVVAIREVESALGTPAKECQPEEANTRSIARRSVVAARTIAKGDIFSAENLICKRPAATPDQVTPMEYWGLLGLAAKQEYAADAPISQQELLP